MYVFIDSQQSEIYSNDITWRSFAAILQEEFNFDGGYWEVALKEIRLKVGNDTSGLFLISSDIVQTSLTYGRQENALRAIHIDRKKRNVVHLEFADPYYFPVSCRETSFINFTINNVDPQTKGDIKRVWLVLHFRQKA